MGKKKVAEEKPQKSAPSTGEGAVSATPKAVSAKKPKRVDTGRVYVNSTYNNTVITVTDTQGNVITWASAGAIGFSGPKKATPFAASKVVGVLSEKMKNIGMQNVEIILCGIAGGRDSAIRSLVNQGFNILSLKDVTPIPHNGPRRAKVRRV